MTEYEKLYITSNGIKRLILDQLLEGVLSGDLNLTQISKQVGSSRQYISKIFNQNKPVIQTEAMSRIK